MIKNKRIYTSEGWRTMEDSAFDRWMKRVDALLCRRLGASINNLPDAPWRDWYNNNVSPERAMMRALSEIV